MPRNTSTRSGTRLADMFGPYVPIFAYFVQPWFDNRLRYPAAMLQSLRRVLRHDVPYVAVSSNDEGLGGRAGMEFNLSKFPNILVVSAGGYGHMAAPLFKTRGHTPEDARAAATCRFSDQHLRRAVSSRPRLVSFVGTVGHAPGRLRERMCEVVTNFSVARNISDQVKIYQGKDFPTVMANSKFSLVPRGFGRTSYHFAETIQAGLIPIHVYSDVPWIPYPEVFEKFGFATDLAGLPALLDRLRVMSTREIEARESLVEQYGRSHFTPEAFAKQLLDFLRNGRGDLRCVKLPPTVRDGDYPEISSSN